MNGNEQFAIGDLVRCKNTGFVGSIRMIALGEGFAYAIVTEGPFLLSKATRIDIDDLERFGATSTPGVENGVKVTPPKGMENMGSNGGYINMMVINKGEPAKQKPAESVASVETKLKGLSSNDKLSIKQALLDAASGGYLTNMTAYGLIEQFHQVDAA